MDIPFLLIKIFAISFFPSGFLAVFPDGVRQKSEKSLYLPKYEKIIRHFYPDAGKRGGIGTD